MCWCVRGGVCDGWGGGLFVCLCVLPGADLSVNAPSLQCQLLEKPDVPTIVVSGVLDNSI